MTYSFDKLVQTILESDDIAANDQFKEISKTLNTYFKRLSEFRKKMMASENTKFYEGLKTAFRAVAMDFDRFVNERWDVIENDFVLNEIAFKIDSLIRSTW